MIELLAMKCLLLKSNSLLSEILQNSILHCMFQFLFLWYSSLALSSFQVSHYLLRNDPELSVWARIFAATIRVETIPVSVS